MFGFNFYGLTKENSYLLIQQIGFPTIGALPLDQSNLTSLSPTKEVWESALNHRAVEIETISNYGDEDDIITEPTDPTLDRIKQSLKDGFLMGTGTLSGTWNYSVVASGEHKGEIAIDRCDAGGLGGHGISIVGYDDDIWIDINYDGQVQTAEMGALKIANSWGDTWGNDGFVWVAYDSLNATSQVLTDSEQTRINNAIAAGTIKANKVNNSARKSFFMYKDHNRPKVREYDNSGCLCYVTVNTGSRKEMTMSVTATSKEDGTESTYQFPKLCNEKNNLAWDGTTDATDGTLVFDLENVIPGLSSSNMGDYTWTVTFEDDTVDSYSLTVKDLYFTVDGATEYTTKVSAVPINGKQKVYTMVSGSEEPPVEEEENLATIYYNNSSYDSAYIHYRVGDGEWTISPGMQMCSSSEQSGYTWKYTIDLSGEKEVTVCLNDGDGTWDNNNKQDYTIVEGTYGVSNGNVAKLQTVVITPTPTVTATPEVTEEPTETPEITEIPDETEVPDITESTTPTVSPTVTDVPEETDKPTETQKVTETPVVTEEPTETKYPTETEKVTENPVVTKEPEETKVPTETENPGQTEVPAITTTPTKTENPEETTEPEHTKTPTPAEMPKETEASQTTTTPNITETPKITITPNVTAVSGVTTTPTPTESPKSTQTMVWDNTTLYTNVKSVTLVSASETDTYKIYTNKNLNIIVETNGSNLTYQIVKKGKVLGTSWKTIKTSVTLKNSGVIYIKYDVNGEERVKKTVGVIIDKKKPKVTVSGNRLKAVDKDSGIKSIKVNGKKAKNNSKLKSGKNKIVVVDKAGNKTTKTIEMK